jgi:hypothetical protein
MLNFDQFVVNEADSTHTKIERIRTQISETFDAISDAKKLKKAGDVNSEITSLTKQTELYAKIPNLMKSLTDALKLKNTTPGGTPGTTPRY